MKKLHQNPNENLELLIATIKGRYTGSPLSKSLLGNEYVCIINQVEKSTEEISHPNALNVYEFGLSKSRNLAILKATQDIGLICDDDIQLMPETHQHIMQAFLEYPNADIITFKIQTPEGDDFRKYPKLAYPHDIHSVLKVSSVEIAFKIDSIKRAGLKFDENFGLGAKFPVGEENIFLMDALRKGLKVQFVPNSIVIHPRIGTGLNYDNLSLFIARGAFFMRAYGLIKGPIYTLAYFFKNFIKISTHQPPFKLLYWLWLGNLRFLKTRLKP